MVVLQLLLKLLSPQASSIGGGSTYRNPTSYDGVARGSEGILEPLRLRRILRHPVEGLDPAPLDLRLRSDNLQEADGIGEEEEGEEGDGGGLWGRTPPPNKPVGSPEEEEGDGDRPRQGGEVNETEPGRPSAPG